MNDPVVHVMLAVSVFCFGSVLGSFFNVLIWRMPRGESIVHPGSHCPSCGRPVRPLENIPLFSFVFLRGKCAGCKATISPQYPLVELTGAISSVLIYLYLIAPQLAAVQSTPWLGIVLAAQAASLLLLIPVAVIDLRTYLIYDVFTIPGLIVSVLLSLIPGGLTPLQCLYGILAGGGSLFLVGLIGEFVLRKKEAMGGGDIKLMAFYGALWGWELALTAIILASFLGALAGLIMLLLRRLNKDHRIPFGPFLAGGVWIAALAGNVIVARYFQFMDSLFLTSVLSVLHVHG